MSKSSQILVLSNTVETRLALIAKGRLQELHIEDTSDLGLLGNIYKGRVARVLPGMEAAFIDIGEEKHGFLPAREIVSNTSSGGSSNQKLNISALLHQGQNCLVQVIKEGVEEKGPQLTANLSLPTPNLVYLPYAQPGGVVVSNKIEDPAMRDKLKWLIEEELKRLAEDQELLGTIIIRTNAVSASMAALSSELGFLFNRQARLQEQSASKSAPALLLEELPLHLRALRDSLPDDVEEVVFSDRSQYDSASEFSTRYFPSIRPKLRMIEDGDDSRLQLIDKETQEALSRTVTLPSGANLIFDHTAALTVVDVNTASFVGKKNTQDTLLQTNIEAATVLAQQLRLRGVGGIIIVDFIDMESVADRQKLLQVLQTELHQDPVPTTCAAKSDLGLIEISRQRSRISLMQSVKQTCASCYGSGWVYSDKSVSLEILAELADMINVGEVNAFTVYASNNIIQYLRTYLDKSLQELRDSFDIEISLNAQNQIGAKPYRIQLGGVPQKL